MNSTKVKIGVVGVGHLGRWHVQQLKLIPEADLVGIYDIDSKKSKQIAKEFHTEIFSTAKKLISECDAVLSPLLPAITIMQYKPLKPGNMSLSKNQLLQRWSRARKL